MSEINQLAQERQRLMQDFLSVKTQLAKAREENETLRQQNTKLNIAIEERVNSPTSFLMFNLLKTD
jgi:regulator of replication initiation timing